MSRNAPPQEGGALRDIQKTAARDTIDAGDRKRPIPLIYHLVSPIKAPSGDSKEAITNRNKFRQVSRMHMRTYIVDFSSIT